MCAVLSAFILVFAATAAAQDPSTPVAPVVSTAPSGTLRTFELAKPAGVALDDRRIAPAAAPPRPPRATESLRTMIGVGYVQGADWGTEILAGGSVAGAQVQFNTLLTSGRQGLLFDHGSLSIFNPDARWHVEAGDVFSPLRGAARGGRLSWPAAGDRRPAIAVYAPGRGTTDRGTVVSYRDQVVVRGQTLIDAEVASDRSYLLRSRFAVPRIDVEASYRQHRNPSWSRDSSIAGGVTLWRGVSLNGGLFDSIQGDGRNDWRMVAVRFPVARFLHLTLERAFAGALETSNTTTAAMASIAAGNLRLFHRYQHGEYAFGREASSINVERQQLRSMSSYSAGPRLNLTLQLATERSDTGPVQHWQELQTTLKATATTTLRTVTALPDIRNPRRFQAYLRQELPGRLALQADYGRLSAYQWVPRELDRSRFKLMLFKTLDIATPARGATVTGRVLDSSERGVRGVRVKLGPYSADVNEAGVYRFAHVPRGEYELSLDPGHLPADVAWDGRGVHVVVRPGAVVRADLHVTPLNAIHGRVYVDRNGNGRFDSGEAVAGAAIGAGEHLTASDADGAYSFYNLWPGTYVIELLNLPAAFDRSAERRTAVLTDDGPATGIDFRVATKAKPILWGGPSK